MNLGGPPTSCNLATRSLSGRPSNLVQIAGPSERRERRSFFEERTPEGRA